MNEFNIGDEFFVLYDDSNVLNTKTMRIKNALVTEKYGSHIDFYIKDVCLSISIPDGLVNSRFFKTKEEVIENFISKLISLEESNETT